MNDSAGFGKFETAQEREEHVKRVVEQWGESFRKLAENPRLEFDGDEIRIWLWKKIKVSGQEADRLTMVEPSLDDLMKLDQVRGDLAQARRLIISSCSLTDREAGQLGMRDLGLFGQLAAAFSNAAPATGSTF